MNPSNSPDKLVTDVWLLKGLSNAPGSLELDGDRLSFTIHGPGGLRAHHLRALEEMAGQPGLAEQLEGGQGAGIFSVPLEQVNEVVFPWYYFNGGVKFVMGAARYRFSFIEPVNQEDGGGGILDGIRTGKKWKAALRRT